MNMDKSREMGKRLHATLGKMEVALGSINEAIVWTDREGIIQWCNSAFDSLAGRPHIFILGKDLTELLPLNRKGQGVRRQDHPIGMLMNKKEHVDEVYEFLSPGQIMFLEISGRRVKAGEDQEILILSVRDVTELTLSRRALEKAKQTLELRVENRTRKLLEITDQYKSILVEAVDAIITINPRGIIQSFNPAAEKIFGYTQDEAVGRNVTLIIPAPFKHEHDRYLRNYLETGKKAIIGIGREVAGVHRTGRKIPLYLGVSEVRLKDRIIFTGVLRDITEQEKAEKALKQARDEAESANRAKSAFLANMSHEIRTPMNAVLGFSELLSPLVSDGKPKQYLEAIMSSGKGLLTIINDILDLSKIEAGKLDLNYDRVDMRALLEEIRQIFMPGIREKRLTFTIETGPGLAKDNKIGSPAVMLDEIRMRQILLNLAGNAVKFTSQGEISLTADLVGHELHIRVKDTGIGIPKARQEMIFKAFEQQEGDTAKDYGGTGLGLTITRRLVGMMNGSLSLESVQGKGSEFKVVLKDVVLADPVLPGDRASETGMAGILFEPATVLVVDDVASNRDLIREMLSGLGIDVIEADSGRTGLDMMVKESPDLVILDIRMPGMDGHDVLRAIRKNIGNLPVICMTASVSPADQAGWEDEGFDLFLSKPVDKEELVRGLRLFLAHGVAKPVKTQAESQSYAGTGARMTAKDAKGLARTLKALLDSGWNDSQGVLEMDRVEDFGNTLAALAEKHGTPDLAEYAQDLIGAAESFDIDRVRAGLGSFPDLVAVYSQASD